MSALGFAIAQALVVVVGLFGASVGSIAAIRRLQTERKRRALLNSDLSNRFLLQFNDREITRALWGYVAPHCSPADPANRDGEEYLADTREPIFSYMDRNIENIARSYHLLLADTGMGKTTFCLNYFAHVRRRFPRLNICLVSLASKDYEAIIRSIPVKSNTVLIADAFDEDSKGWSRGRERLSQLLELSADFKTVIITCRSQYFISDDAIPRETPLPILVPRQLGQSPTFSLVRSYISPFSKEEISKYIDRHFPILYFWRYQTRRRAKKLVESVPDLSYRPMLLERLPDLARTPTRSRELFDLYDLLVNGWLVRESRWIEEKDLRVISTELAIRMYREFAEKNGRLTPRQIDYMARTKISEKPDWRHLTSRSLLNRDSQGSYKFAHKSILEFLVVKAACEGDDRAVETIWTPFMKDIFVSWGNTELGRDRWERAQEILRSPKGRANISPLFDMLGTSAVRGVPDFRRCAERRRTATGERLAPASWRASSVDVIEMDEPGNTTINDAEFNLRWRYVKTPKSDIDIPPLKLFQALKYAETQRRFRLPSYEQFVALIEGLHRADKDILPDGKLFLIEDKPAKSEYIIVEKNSEVRNSPHLKCIDKNRRVAGTSVHINSYLTGPRVSAGHARALIVEYLYIEDFREEDGVI